MAEPGRDPDEFDRIVEQLDLDLSFPDEPTEPARTEPVEAPVEEEPFYRRVEPTARPWRRGTSLAWAAVLGAPLSLVLCSMLAYIVPRPVLVALVLLFLAGVLYLVSQLPEHGPADPDDPDDGAVL